MTIYTLRGYFFQFLSFPRKANRVVCCFLPEVGWITEGAAVVDWAAEVEVDVDAEVDVQVLDETAMDSLLQLNLGILYPFIDTSGSVTEDMLLFLAFILDTDETLDLCLLCLCGFFLVNFFLE